jgi:glycosyltransferase involved in cell wall biosynthesis
MKVLFVMSELPYPPRLNGYTLRYHSLLKHLSHEVEIEIALPKSTDDYPAEHRRELLRFVKSIHFLSQRTERPGLLRRMRGMLSMLLPFGVPYHVLQHNAEVLATRLAEIVRENFDAVVWAGLGNSHVLHVFRKRFSSAPIFLDAIDSAHLYVARNVANRGTAHRLRLAKLHRWEASLLNEVDVAMYISPVDLLWMQKSVSKPLLLLPNGVTINDYRSDAVPQEQRTIGFLGNMSYAPNVEAAFKLHTIFRALKQSIPDLQLWFVGRDPSPQLMAGMGTEQDVHFTGAVDNIWPHVNSIDVFVLPMMSGAGQQNKVLEIMYAGRPVVCTTIANGGIGAPHGEALFIADDTNDMLLYTQRLLEREDERRTLGMNGKRFVEQNFSWETISRKLLDALSSARLAAR